MKQLQRHWRSMTVVIGVLVLAGGMWWSGAGDRVALADPPLEALTVLQRDANRTLLEENALDRDALVALNPTAAQAESILATVRTWQGNNAATLASLRLVIHERVHAVRLIEQAAAMGPAVAGRDQSLAQAREDIQTAQAAYANACTTLRADVHNLLSVSQRITWLAIESGHGQRMPLRMLALTDGQRLSLSEAWRVYRHRQAAADAPNDRTNARNGWESDRNQILTQDQQTIVTAYHNNYAEVSAAVATAFDNVLAVQ